MDVIVIYAISWRDQMRTYLRFNNKAWRLLIALIFTFASINPAHLLADSPDSINYQGKLADNNGNPLTGNYPMTFEVYSAASGGTFLYGDDRTTNLVPVTNGIFNVLVGTGTAMGGTTYTNIRQAAQSGTSIYLQVRVSGTALLPRQRLVASPYALAVAQGSIANAEVASGAGITVTKLAPGTFPTGAYSFSGSTVTFSGSGIWKSDGSVGIGTTTPGQKLTVVGDALISGLGGGGTQMVVVDNNGLLSVQSIPGGGSAVAGSGSASRLAYWTSSSNLSYNTNLYWDNTNVRLGIGTTTPSQELTVAGDAIVTGLGGGGTQMVVADNNGLLSVQSIPTGSITGSGSASRLTYWTSGSNISYNSNLYWDNTNTRLGIGLTNPSTSLHVSGAAIITGAITLSNLSGSGSRMVVSDASGVLSATTIPSGTVTGTGSANRLPYWDSTSNLTFNTNLYWDNTNTRLGIGLTNPSTTLHVSGTANITGATTLAGTVSFSGTSTDITTVSGQDFAILPNGAGQVGIGTTNPGYMLEVAGTLGLKSDATNTGELKVGYTSSAPAGYYATYSP